MAVVPKQQRPGRVLTCSECVLRHPDGLNRIGNRKSSCTTCNRFAQAVRRRVHTLLREQHPRLFARAVATAETEIYSQTDQEQT